MQKAEYADLIRCPVCGKVLGEWVEVTGTVIIRKKCPRCKEMRLIKKES